MYKTDFADLGGLESPWQPKRMRARLDEYIIQGDVMSEIDRAVERVNELSRAARGSWLSLLTFLAFIGVTLLGVEDADFFIDPWRKVDRAVITHGHSDHARPGAGSYLCAAPCVGALKTRLGKKIAVQGVPFGESLRMGDARVSFHPAGHVLGSALIRVESRGEVWVVSGDYKLENDGISGAFEPVRCDTFITESTFGLPIYRWRRQAEIFEEIRHWWRDCQARGKTAHLLTYSLGKAQRLLAGLGTEVGPIVTHKAIEGMLAAYESEGVRFPPHFVLGESGLRTLRGRALILAPPSAQETSEMAAFSERETAMASGWTRMRGARGGMRRAGFALSDHVDWPDLMRAIELSQARRILVTHGYSQVVTRYLREQGLEAAPLETEFSGESEQ